MTGVWIGTLQWRAELPLCSLGGCGEGDCVLPLCTESGQCQGEVGVPILPWINALVLGGLQGSNLLALWYILLLLLLLLLLRSVVSNSV